MLMLKTKTINVMMFILYWFKLYIFKMVDDVCIICFKKLRINTNYNFKVDWMNRNKHYSCYKKERDTHSSVVMLNNWLLDRTEDSLKIY
jgi:hypothetical protein